MVSVSRLDIYCVENNFIMTPTHLDNPDEGHEKKDGHEIIKLFFISPGGFLCDGSQVSKLWDMSFKTKHVNHLLAPAVKSTTRVIRIHCLGTMTVWKKKAGNPSNCSWEISVWTKVVEQQMDCLILASTKPGMAKNVVCEHNPGNYISDHNLIGKISITETENHIIKKEANYNWCS